MINGMNQIWSMGLIWVISLIALTLMVWLTMKVINQKNNLNRRITRSPLGILKTRYVRGKIGKKEYAKRRSAIL